jgi:DNA polymerase I
MPDLDIVLRRLREEKVVGYDVETSGIDWRRCHPVGHVLSFGPRDDDSYYIPIRCGGGGNIYGGNPIATTDGWAGDIHPFEKEMVALLERPGRVVFGHNLSYDTKFLYRLGMTKFDADWDDTMINAALLNEHQSSFSLDFCCKTAGVAQKKTSLYEYIATNIPEAKGQTKNAMAHFWRLAGNDPQAVAYAIGDGQSTWQLREKQLVDLAAQKLTLVHSVECRLIPVLARMTCRGIKIDEQRLHEIKRIAEQRRDQALSELPKEFNSRAPSQVRKLMEDGGFLDWPMTAPSKTHPKGVPSFNEQWLLTNPIGQKIVRARKYSNLLNSFIEPMIETHMWKGRVHCDFHQLRGDQYGTITGRLSSSNPNSQQVVKHNEEMGRLHRSIFVPDEGMVWGSADYSQMEPRLLAYYSRCKVLMDGYKATPPIDAHQAVATAANLDRNTGKRVNQTIITGGGKKVLVSRYGVDPAEVERIWDDYFRAMPEVRTIQKQAAARMRDRGYVISLLGRRCRLIDRNKDYVALNRLLQTGNADCLKYKMGQIDSFLKSEGDRVHMLLNCHDALEFQFHPEDKRIYDRALEIMTFFGEGSVIQLDVPVVVDHKEGKNWSEATYGDAGLQQDTSRALVA